MSSKTVITGAKIVKQTWYRNIKTGYTIIFILHFYNFHLTCYLNFYI